MARTYQLANALSHTTAARPVVQRAARHVARADDEVGGGAGRDQPHQIVGIVREVGVHLADVARAGAHARPACRPRRSGRARARRCGASRATRPPLAAARRSAIAPVPSGDAVVHDQHPQPVDGEQPRDQHADVLALVVGGHDDQHAVTRPSLAGRGRSLARGRHQLLDHAVPRDEPRARVARRRRAGRPRRHRRRAAPPRRRARRAPAPPRSR